MIVPDQLVQDLVTTLAAIRAALERPTASEDRLLTIEDLCARWGISRSQFYKAKFDEVLPYCELTEDGRPRYQLRVVVAYEQTRMRNPDGSPVHPPEPEKRAIKRRRVETPELNLKSAA